MMQKYIGPGKATNTRNGSKHNRKMIVSEHGRSVHGMNHGTLEMGGNPPLLKFKCPDERLEIQFNGVVTMLTDEQLKAR
jgi:hypothetical protein